MLPAAPQVRPADHSVVDLGSQARLILGPEFQLDSGQASVVVEDEPYLPGAQVREGLSGLVPRFPPWDHRPPVAEAVLDEAGDALSAERPGIQAVLLLPVGESAAEGLDQPAVQLVEHLVAAVAGRLEDPWAPWVIAAAVIAAVVQLAASGPAASAEVPLAAAEVESSGQLASAKELQQPALVLPPVPELDAAWALVGELATH